MVENKKQPKHKQPPDKPPKLWDKYAFVYIENKKQPVFHVIMEVRFFVLANIREWLVATEGGVNLDGLFKIAVPERAIDQLGGLVGSVTTIKNNEDDASSDDNSEERGEAVELDVGEDQSDSCSDAEDYYCSMDTMSNGADNWIGRYTVFMETWVYEATTGERFQ